MYTLKTKFKEFNLKDRLKNLIPLVENNGSKISIENAYNKLQTEDLLYENMKVITDRQDNTILIERIKLLENLNREIKAYDWNKDIESFLNESVKFLNENSLRIITESVIYDLSNSKNSEHFKNSIDKLKDVAKMDNLVESILNELNTEKWVPLIGKLYEYTEKLKGSYKGKNPNFNINKVYSPVEVLSENKYVIHSNGLNLLVEDDIISVYENKLSNSFESLVKVTESAKFSTNTITLFPSYNSTLEIDYINESYKLNGEEININNIETYLTTKGIVNYGDRETLSNISRTINEGKNIKEIDIAYKVTSKLYEGLSATIFNLNDNIYVQLKNTGMKDNKFILTENVNEAIEVVKEFINFDITESVKYLIDEENRIEDEYNKQYEFISNKIKFLKESLLKIDRFILENGKTESVLDAKKTIQVSLLVQEEELNNLKKK